MEKIQAVQYKDIAGNEEKAKNKNPEVVLDFRNEDIIEPAFVDASSRTTGGGLL